MKKCTTTNKSMKEKDMLGQNIDPFKAHLFWEGSPPASNTIMDKGKQTASKKTSAQDRGERSEVLSEEAR